MTEVERVREKNKRWLDGVGAALMNVNSWRKQRAAAAPEDLSRIEEGLAHSKFCLCVAKNRAWGAFFHLMEVESKEVTP